MLNDGRHHNSERSRVNLSIASADRNRKAIGIISLPDQCVPMRSEIG